MLRAPPGRAGWGSFVGAAQRSCRMLYRLSALPSRFQVMDTTTHPTTCPLDCPDTCALDVSLQGTDVVKIGAGQDHPVTNGFICSKVSRFANRLSHETRLAYPMRRVGRKGDDAFERISWRAAIEQITERFRGIRAEWGGEALLGYHYGGSNGLLSDGFLDDLYFARLGASRLEMTICAAPTSAVALGMYGKMPGVAFEDYVHAKCIIIWGANPKASNTHLTPFLKEAKRRGAFIASVDPVRNFSPREVDLHLPVRPGADLAVALAMVRLCRESGWLDEGFLSQHAVGGDRLLDAAADWPVERAAEMAGVDPDDIAKLTQVYAESSPAVVRCGWGVERNRNGGQAVAAILALPTLLGKFAVRGGGYTMSNSGAAKVDKSSFFDLSDWKSRSINMTKLGEVLGGELEPPIKGLFVYNCNPVATVPEQARVIDGLARDDLFTVVFDQVMTDTAAFADIVLPATTFLEHRDLKISYGSYVVAGVVPVIPRSGEARSNHDVFSALGRAMSFADEAFQWDEETAFERMAECVSYGGEQADLDTLSAGGVHRLAKPAFRPIQFQDVSPRMSDRRVNLCPSALGDAPYEYENLEDVAFPLALLSPATSKLTSSTFGEFNLPRLKVVLNPQDAGSRGIHHGSRVRVFNGLGEVVCIADVSDSVRQGVASMPKGAWRKASGNGFTSTALCPATVNVVAGGACFNDARVEVEPAPDDR